jgi:integrase
VPARFGIQPAISSQATRSGLRASESRMSTGREVIMMNELARLLREKRVAARFSADPDLIVGHGVGKTLGYTKLLKAYTKSANDAGIEGATPHTCRHTFASIRSTRALTLSSSPISSDTPAPKPRGWDIYIHLFRAREHAEAASRNIDAAFGPMLRAAGDDASDE